MPNTTPSRYTVARPFPTRSRRLAAGAVVTAADLVDDAMPLADRAARGFLVPMPVVSSRSSTPPAPPPAPPAAEEPTAPATEATAPRRRR